MSSATRVASTIVSPTLTTVNVTVRATTCQKNPSPSTVA